MTRAAVSSSAAAVLFLYLPIAVLAVFSFNASKLMAFPAVGLHARLVPLAGRQHQVPERIRHELPRGPAGRHPQRRLGLGAALALTSARRAVRLGLAGLLLVPFLVPKTVLSIAQSMVLARLGLDRGAATLITAETIVAVPFAAAIIASVLARLDPRLEEAARDLGATPWICFRRITFPADQVGRDGGLFDRRDPVARRSHHRPLPRGPNPAAVARRRLRVPPRAQPRPQRHAGVGPRPHGSHRRADRGLRPLSRRAPAESHFRSARVWLRTQSAA